MAGKTPFDVSKMFPVFGPEEMFELMNPGRVFSVFEAETPRRFDMASMMEANRRNVETLLQANKAAAEAYHEILDRQIEACAQFTAAVRGQASWMEGATTPDAVAERTEAYAAALERALELMQKLGETAREANRDALATMQGQVRDALDEVRKQTTK